MIIRHDDELYTDCEAINKIDLRIELKLNGKFSLINVVRCDGRSNGTFILCSIGYVETVHF